MYVKGFIAHKQRSYAELHECLKRGIEITIASNGCRIDAYSKLTRCGFRQLEFGGGGRRILGINQSADLCDAGYKIVQEFHAFWHELDGQISRAR
jgi:hypothetical protein